MLEKDHTNAPFCQLSFNRRYVTYFFLPSSKTVCSIQYTFHDMRFPLLSLRILFVLLTWLSQHIIVAENSMVNDPMIFFSYRDVLRKHYKSCRSRLALNADIPDKSNRGKPRQACDNCAVGKRACDSGNPCGTCVTYVDLNLRAFSYKEDSLSFHC